MPDTKISALTAVVTPASTDEFAVNQGGTSKKMTRAQVHTLESGESLIGENAAGPSIVDEAATVTNPTLIPNRAELTTGIGWSSAGILSLIASAHVELSGANAPALVNAVASDTVPTLCPAKLDLDTGIGRRTNNIANLVAGALNCMEWANVTAAPAVGFYGTNAIVKQTGVAVTEVAIHAALVALGLIAGP